MAMSHKPWAFPPAIQGPGPANSPFAAPTVIEEAPCPCGSGRTYGGCCQPHHRERTRPATAEELMRARYSAFAARQADFLWRTWHPRTRPELITFEDGVAWTGLEILDVVAGGDGDRDGIVEFRACYTENGTAHVLHERSRFVVRAHRWMYVDGEHFQRPPRPCS